MSQNGKGDCPRPMSISRDEYNNNWEKAFGKPADPASSEAIAGVKQFFKMARQRSERGRREEAEAKSNNKDS